MKERMPMGRVVFGGIALLLAAASCSRGERVLGEGFDPEGNDTPELAATAEAGTVDASGELLSYCPSNRCPAGHTTCSTSRFPCDVNLNVDRDNCGACGAACPANTLRESYECVDGQCFMSCNKYPTTLDCDGIPDNGCETSTGTNENCAACGDACTDPERPCLNPTIMGAQPRCGCDKGQTYCASAWPLFCVDVHDDDNHCGACNNACDPTGGGAPTKTNTYYGCRNDECGQLKCNLNYADCNANMDDGCETFLFSNESCGACGKVCPAGTECKADASGRAICACPAGQTFCEYGCYEGICAGECVDFAADPENCGACGFRCADLFATNTIPVCSFGTCSLRCPLGRADCNGNTADDCEVDTNSDPRNCGGCGITCDAIAGQACVGGQCVVEPCEQDAGPVEAR